MEGITIKGAVSSFCANQRPCVHQEYIFFPLLQKPGSQPPAHRSKRVSAWWSKRVSAWWSKRVSAWTSGHRILNRWGGDGALGGSHRRWRRVVTTPVAPLLSRWTRRIFPDILIVVPGRKHKKGRVAERGQ